MPFYVMNDDLPNWTEVAQVVIGLSGMVAALWTLIKLVSRDKQRESEIASLSMIATQLKDLQLLNESATLKVKSLKWK